MRGSPRRGARAHGAIGFALAAAALAFASCATVGEARRERPNVLFVISDDLTATALGCYGNALCATPNIDRLARRGVRFTRAYCQYPVCGPSRASMMSGLYPEALPHGGEGGTGDAAQPGPPSLGEHFIRHGYHTVRVSKVYHMRVPGDITSGSDGADHPAAWIERYNCRGPEWATAGVREALSNEKLRFEPDVHYGLGFGTAFYTVRAAPDAARQPDALAADKAIELLRAHRDEPFLLAVGFVRPHVPLVAPEADFRLHPPERMQLPPTREGDWDDIPPAGIPPYTSPRRGLEDPETKRKVLAAYYAAVSFMDEQLGRVLDELDALGLADDTIVVFTSDHGYHLGEHDFWQKLSLHEESARIPLLIAAPGMTPGECDALVEGVDLYPTLAELAGLPVPPHCQGRSLAPLLAGARDGVRDAAYSITGKGRLLRTERWAYIEYRGGEAELYDMRADPQQFTNLALLPEYAATRAALAERLDEKLSKLVQLDAAR